MDFMDKYMFVAFKEALKAVEKDEVPVGAVIVKNGKIIAKAHNVKENSHNPLMHAEINCINKASKKMNNWRMDDCDIYITLEPCTMCMGAIINARFKNVCFMCNDPKTGSLGGLYNMLNIKGFNHYPNVIKIEDKYGYSDILKSFFRNKRK